jgi:preprotein translocase subunit SecY
MVFKILTLVTMPLINAAAISSTFDNTGFLGIVNSISGNALKHYSIVALGITPYITASIITQILQMDIIPALKEWSEEGETGKKKIQRLNRYLAMGLAFVQALAMTFAFHSTQTQLFQPFVSDWATANGRNLWFLIYFYIAIVLTAGTAFMIWLADQITLKGFGNGSSMLIVGGIIMSLPGTIASIFQFYISDPSGAMTTVYANQGAWSGYALFGVSILMFIVVLVGVTYMQIAIRKIPIQYANRPASSKFKGKSDSNIPIKLNTAGVIPVVFASIILSLPSTIFQYINVGATAKNWITQVLTYNQPIGFVVYVVLIFTFTFFYSFIIVKPEQISERLHKQNAYIPGVRPGYETETYITRTLFRVTVIGALYLILIASLPIITSIVLGQSYIRIGGTSLLIIVGVSIETAKQIQTDTQDKTYAGFMR